MAISVALFTRAWIEILYHFITLYMFLVALFTRAWIEITRVIQTYGYGTVALFTRAWIEIDMISLLCRVYAGRPLHEGVD